MNAKSAHFRIPFAAGKLDTIIPTVNDVCQKCGIRMQRNAAHRRAFRTSPKRIDQTMVRCMRAFRFPSRTRVALAFFSFGFFPATLFAVPTTQHWVDQLSSEESADRVSAEIHLQRAGTAVVEPLRVAAGDPRPEVSDRARRILRRIQILTLPDQPQRALSTCENYLSEPDPQLRKLLLNRLFELKPQVDPLLARLVVMEPDDDLRRQILYRLRTGYRDSVGRWLAVDNDPLGVLQLLNGAAAMWGQECSADYAAALNTCGLIDQQTQVCRAEQANGDTDEAARAARQLCFFYRLENKPELALKAARNAREPSLVFLVLTDQGNWDAAAKEQDDLWHDRVIATSLRAGYQRLAGQPQKARETMTTLSRMTNPDADNSFVPSKLFMLNDMPERGMELMTDRHPSVVFAMRVERGEIAQALDLSEKYAHMPIEGPLLANEVAELHRTLGELPELPLVEPKPVPPAPLVAQWQMAVTDLSQKRYRQAADEFASLWEMDHSQYDRLFLKGYVTKQAGDIQRGQTLMQTAEMIPLGDPLARWKFANQLEAAGLSDLAETQRQMGLRSGAAFDEVGFSEIYFTIANAAAERKQWQIAADAQDRLCLMNLSPQLGWPGAERLLSFPARAHLLNSLRDRERGDLALAMQELKAYQQYLPASSEMVLEWVPALDGLGQHEKADALFDGVYEKLKAICDKYPRSIAYQNQLAWMCACCGRKLDIALVLSQSAVSLNPNSWQTMDTLAEIHFRRGERQAAIDIERRAAGLSEDAYVSRQLKRLEGAPIPSTTQPGAAPE